MIESHSCGITDVDWAKTKDCPIKSMTECKRKAKAALTELAPIIRVQADSNIMSSCYVTGSFDPMGTHTNGIFENSKYFKFSITPAKGKRYHKENGEVTIELRLKHHSLAKFRKSTTTEEKAILRIVKWINENRPGENDRKKLG